MKLKVLNAIGIFTFLLSATTFAQNENRFGNTEEQRYKCKEQISIYQTLQKQKDYTGAYKPWQEACATCPPTATEAIFGHGPKIIKNQIKISKDSVRKAVLVDSLMMIYDQRIEHFPETKKKPHNKYYILALKASDYAKYNSDNREEIYTMFKEAVNGSKEKSSASALSGYYIALFNMRKNAETDEDKEKYSGEIIEQYLTVIDYAKTAKEATKKDTSKERFDKSVETVEGIFVQIADCESMVPVLERNVTADPENMELMEKSLRLMNKKDCDDSDFYLMVAEKVFKSKETPTAEAAFSLGIAYLKQRNFNESLQYLEMAVELCEGCEDEEKYNLRAGQVASNQKQGGKAMRFANAVLKLNPKSGDAYLLKGDAMMGMSGACADDGINGSSAYLKAADYYGVAKSVDPEVADKANSKAAAARKRFPSNKELFVVGKKVGDTVSVPATGDTTKIRTRD